MKAAVSILSLVISIHVSLTLSELTFLQFVPSLGVRAASNEKPILDMPNTVLPPTSDNKDAEPSGALTISDVIGKERGINIFAGFTRDIDTISKRLDDPNCNTTVLAPLNSELQKLPRKPWEDPKDYGAIGPQAYKGADGEDRAHKNLRRFVEAHVVPASPWKEGDKVNVIAGRQIWWEGKDGKKTVFLLVINSLADTDIDHDYSFNLETLKSRRLPVAFRMGKSGSSEGC